MTAKENDQSNVDNSDVIDAEIIEEQSSDTTRTVPKPVEESAQKSSAGKLGWLIAFVLLVFVGGLFAAPYVRSGLVDAGILAPVAQQSATAASEQSAQFARTLSNLQAQLEDNNQTIVRQQEMIAQLMERLDNVNAAQQQTAQDVGLIASQNGTASQASDGQVAALQAEVNRLTNETARLAALANTQNPEVASINGQIALARAENDRLKNQIQSLQVAISGLQEGALSTTPRGRLLIVLGRIKEQAQAGLSFDAELNSAQLDIAALPAIDQQLVGADFTVLASNASGITSFEILNRRFGEMARSVKLAQEKGEGGFLANLFTVRRTDDGATGVDAVLLNAERRLQARDVAGAVSALLSLEGDARAAAEEWINQANAFTETMTAIDRLLRTVAGRGPQALRGGQR